MRRKKFTAEKEAILLDPNAAHTQRSSAINCMRSDGLRLHEALVLSFLDDPSEHLRTSALQTAVHWDTLAYLPLLGQRMRNDPSDWLRGHAATTAWWVGKNFPEQKATMLSWLAHMVDVDEDSNVRRTAYEQFIDLESDGAERFDIGKEDFDPERHVDRARLEPYLSDESTPLLH